MTLTELTPNQWTTIAVRVRHGDNEGWEYLLQEEELQAFAKAVSGGRYLMAQKRGEDGRMQLVAKVKRRAW